MSPDSLLNVMAAAVAVSAVALVAQAVMVFGMFRAIRALRDQVSSFLPRAERFVANTEKALAENQQQIKEVTSRAISVLDEASKQMVRVDAFVGDFTTKARAQMERLEIVLDDSVSRAHHTVVQLNNTVTKPMRELAGLTAGFRAALQYFISGGRPNVAQATSDEEMFI